MHQTVNVFEVVQPWVIALLWLMLKLLFAAVLNSPAKPASTLNYIPAVVEFVCVLLVDSLEWIAQL